jgi:hypothetical protein
MERQAMEHKIKVKGTVELVVVDKTGKIIEERRVDNLIVNTGLSQLTDYIAGNAPGIPVSHIAIGDGQTPVQPTDTTLENELHREPATITVDSIGVVEYQHIWAIGTATGSYFEAGMFNADADGTMFNRVTFPELIVEDIHQLIVTWTISIVVTEVL